MTPPEARRAGPQAVADRRRGASRAAAASPRLAARPVPAAYQPGEQAVRQRPAPAVVRAPAPAVRMEATQGTEGRAASAGRRQRAALAARSLARGARRT